MLHFFKFIHIFLNLFKQEKGFNLFSCFFMCKCKPICFNMQIFDK